MSQESPKIAKIVVDIPVDEAFDYAIPAHLMGILKAGHRVRVLFRRRKLMGIIVNFAHKSDFKKLNPILELLDPEPVLNPQLLKLTFHLSQYYGCSWGEAIAIALPRYLRKDRTLKKPVTIPYELENLTDGNKGIGELVIGTEDDEYWKHVNEICQKSLDQKKNVLIVVPEANQAEYVISKLISPVVKSLTESLTEKQEFERWRELISCRGSVVVGMRSAIFAPLTDLGLIVVCDENNPNMKQTQSPYYHVREVARMRAHVSGCRLLFAGSAPSLELWHEAERKSWPKHFVSTPSTSIQPIDMSNYKSGKGWLLSYPLQNSIRQSLEAGQKVLLLMNRRGYAMATRCEKCSKDLKCSRCDVNLSYLLSKKKLVCRHCAKKTDMPKTCPSCFQPYLKSMGKGIERFQQDVAKFFPEARISHFDKESSDIPKGFDILIATQAILSQGRSVDFKFASIIDFDSQLNRFDFRSSEQSFALLRQLQSGIEGKVMVQTHMADHYALHAVRSDDLAFFYKKELQHRRDLQLPPYYHCIEIGLRSVDEDVVFKHSLVVYERLVSKKPNTIEVMDPAPDAIPKLRDQYRHTIMLKAKTVRPALLFIKEQLKALKIKKNVTITVNVDPY